MYGVPASAGRVLSLEGGLKHLEIHDETASDRLKPGLHTLYPSFACEICGLATNGTVKIKLAQRRIKARKSPTAKLHLRKR